MIGALVDDPIGWLGSIVAYAFSDAGPYGDIDTTDAEVEFSAYFAEHPCSGDLYFVGPTFSYVGRNRG